MKLFSNIKNNSSAPELKIITLSGVTSVTKNMTLYECGDDIIAVDCGVGFPDAELLGVDVVIPDFTYLIENKHKFKALFITHGHEDHIGAVPYLLQELNVPIYAGKLVQGFLNLKFSEKKFKNLNSGVSMNLISPHTEEVTVGNFKVSAFRVNHSVPSSMGFEIKTPQGTVVHMADYKIDWSPVIDKPIDLGRIAQIANEGVLCLLSDCLGATTEGYAESEKKLDNTFFDLFENAVGRQIFVTTISSNISRIQQIANGALRCGRKLVLSGRSIEQNTQVALNLGYLNFPADLFVKEQEAQNYNQADLVYIIAGCYGQPESSLGRVSRNEHREITLEENALVIFSADPNPPGTQEAVEKVMDNLTLSGAEVLYSQIQDNLHISGHGPKGDLMTIASVVHPQYFIPIGGTVMKIRAYRDMVEGMGFPKGSVFEMAEGDVATFFEGGAKKSDPIPVKQVLIDGGNVSDALNPLVIKDREQLSNDGVLVLTIAISKDTKTYLGKSEIVTRGFVYVKENQSLIGRTRDVVNKLLDKQQNDLSDWGTSKAKLEKEVSKFLFRETGRKPLVIISSLLI